METKQLVKLLDQSGVITLCKLIISNGRPWHISLDGFGADPIAAESHDLFEALVVLRKILEEFGCKMLVAGGRPDVVVSGMSRSMGGGRIGYIVEMGRPAGLNCKIDIFDETDPALVVSVQEQIDFQNKWFASLQGRVTDKK